MVKPEPSIRDNVELRNHVYMRVLFLGDSHLANLDRDYVTWLERELPAEIETAAFGGA